MLPEAWTEKLRTGDSIALIGAHNPISARIGALAGFDGIWWSSFELSTSYGLIDASLVWPDEVAYMVQRSTSLLSLPQIIDADAGYGGDRQLARASACFKQAGASIICVEDQVHPKFNSLFPSVERQLCSISLMVERVKTIRSVLGPKLGVFARLESFVMGGSLKEALERANAYAEAGSDAIVIHSTKADINELAEFSQQWHHDIPLVAIPSTYDSFGTAELAEIGFPIVIYANAMMRSAIKAMHEAAMTLAATQNLSSLKDKLATLDDVKSLWGE